MVEAVWCLTTMCVVVRRWSVFTQPDSHGAVPVAELIFEIAPSGRPGDCGTDIAAFCGHLFPGDPGRTVVARTLPALAFSDRRGLFPPDGLGFAGSSAARSHECGIVVLFVDGICRLSAECGEPADGVAHG